jgi:hypothetical protein
MSLSDGEIVEEMESWKRFGDALRMEDRDLFRQMLRSSYEYAPAMHAKMSPFTTEALFMSLLLMQHKTIIRLAGEIEELRGRRVENAGVDT